LVAHRNGDLESPRQSGSTRPNSAERSPGSGPQRVYVHRPAAGNRRRRSSGRGTIPRIPQKFDHESRPGCVYRINETASENDA
jgi:hypothetical protein